MAEKETDKLTSIMLDGKIIGSWWYSPYDVECESDATGNSWACETVAEAISCVVDDYRSHMAWKKSRR